MKLIKKFNHFYSETMDSGAMYYIIKTLEEDHMKILKKFDIDPYQEYNGVGNFWKDTPFIRRKGKYLIITISWGYDI